MHWYARQMSEIGRREGYRHWVWVLNKGPPLSTTIVFRLEHMLAARTPPKQPHPLSTCPHLSANDTTLLQPIVSAFDDFLPAV